MENKPINKHLDKETVAKTHKNLKDICRCKRNCHQKVSLHDTLRIRETFWNKCENDQNQFLLDFFHSQSFIHSLNFFVNDHPICQNVWTYCHGISSARFYRKKNLYLQGYRDGDTERRGNKSIREPSIIAINWLCDFANDCGDYPPDRSEETRILPSCYTINAVWQTYKEWAKEKNIKPISEDWFRKLWKEKTPFITISKNNRFTKCGLCTLLKDIRRTTRDGDLKSEMQEFRKYHNEQQMGERLKYKHHQEKAKNKPEKYLSLIIDGMDQHKTGLPHFLTLSKAYQSQFVKTHVSGILSHGHEKLFYVIDLHEGPHDSNLTMTLLSYVLTKVAKDGVLPPVLYLQMDNCWRENKNQFLMAFLAYLVEKKILKKIRLSYLLVGHTHEDIDSTFSNISTKLEVTDVFTLVDLVKTIEDSFKTQKPKVSTLKYVFNYREWFRDNIRIPSNHTEPHAYKFELNEEGKCGVWFKRFCMDGEWSNLKPILSHLPVGTPALVRFDWAKQCPAHELREKIKTCEMKLPNQSIAWWENFITDLEKRQTFWKEMSNESLKNTDETFHLNFLKTYSIAPKFSKVTADDSKKRGIANDLIKRSQREPRTKVAKYSKREKEEKEKAEDHP